MWNIFIDASERSNKIVKLTKDEKEISKKTGDIDLVSSLKDILEENNLKITQIDKFSFNPGPGSFTGLKISAAIINTLNWALKKKDLNSLQYPDYGREPNITLKKDL